MINISKLTDVSVDEKKAASSNYELPLSSNQQALWFLHKVAPKSWAYNVLFAVRICSQIDIPSLKRVFQSLSDRHPCLRTTYTTRDNSNPVQQIHQHREIHFQEINASAWSQNELNNRLVEAAQRPFDLEIGPLLRVNVFTQSATEHILLLSGHHIALDFWSLTVLLDELRVLYPAQTGTQALPPAKQYTDYIRWQAEMLASAEGERLWNYWHRQLAGELPILNLPNAQPRPAVQTDRGASHVFKLSEDLTRQIKALAKAESATLYMTLLAAFQVLLYRYTDQEDILVGSPTTGRSRSEFSGIVGNFINPVVLRADLAGNPTFKAFLAQVRHTVQDAFKHQDYPFPLLVEQLAPPYDSSRSPLFQVLFVLEKLHRCEELSEFIVPSETKAQIDWGGLELESFALPQQEGQFDLTLEMIETGDSLSGTWKYNIDLFESASIARMAGHFQTLLSGVVAAPEQTVSTLPLLTAAERHLLGEWNNTKVDYPQDVCIHQVFEAQVKQTPDAIAVFFADKHLTYRELNAQANCLAHHLQTLNVKPEVLVGICLERSLLMVVGILGILKAGGAYVPLDPAYPKERLAFMLEDTQVPVLLTQQHLVEGLPAHTHVVCLDTDWDAIAQNSEENPVSEVTLQSLGYAIYTSGSTGRPKGVKVNHASIRQYVHSVNNELHINPDNLYLHMASFSFASSVRQLMVPLSQGAKVLIATYEQTRNPLLVFNLIQEHGVTVCDTVQSFWHNGIQGLEGLEEVSRKALLKSKLRLIVFCGELLTWELPKTLLRELEHKPHLVNLYALTETTSVCTYPLPNEFDDEAGPVPVGRPVANVQAYILNSQLQPVPIEVPGEFHVGGPGLACGYLQRSELTDEKFIPNPFSDDPVARIHKTGDLARYLPSGNIEILGRIDDQVQLRGMRVELGEIEAVLTQHPTVRTTVVIAREDVIGDQRLVSYIIPNQGQEPIFSELRSFLRERLPEYMMPSAFVLLEALPLNANGKVNRRALPAPDLTRIESETAFVAPRDLLELQLTKIWEKVLGIQPIGVQDNFFDLGGHSLLAVRLFTQIEKAFGKKLPLATLFQAPTIAQLVSILSQEKWSVPWSALVPIQPQGSKSPLFCLHARGGNVLCYRPLASHLGSDQPVYGIQAQGLDEKQVTLTKVEDMAAYYIKQIRTIQPEGPYRLAGYSSGGIVAFEMAQQLHTQGQKVSLLVLLDAFSPQYYQRTGSERLVHFLRLGLKDKMMYLLEKAGVKKMLQRINPKLAQGNGRLSPQAPKQMTPLASIYIKAVSKYVPQVYPNKAIYFRATNDPTHFFNGRLGWDELFAGGLEIHDVPGSHLSMLGQLHVQDLAAKLSACLDEA